MSGMKWNGGVRVGRTETLRHPTDVTIEGDTLSVSNTSNGDSISISHWMVFISALIFEVPAS